MYFHYYLPGIILIVSALLIVAFPQILVILIAGLVFMAGMAALWMGNTMRQMHKYGNNGGQNWFFFRHGGD